MANEEDLESPPPAPKSKLIPIFLIVNAIAMGGMIVIQFIKSGGDEEAAKAPQQVAAPPPPPAAGPAGEPIDPKTGLPMRGPHHRPWRICGSFAQPRHGPLRTI